MSKEPVKIIHYCWFGPKPFTKVANKCIASWKKYLPDYEIKLWNEDNFDFNQNPFVKDAYEKKKWAFVADYARLKALQEFGGIYLDTDIEITRRPDDILSKECFLGIEDSKLVNAAVLGVSAPNNKFINEMIEIYDLKNGLDCEDIYSNSIPRLVTSKLLEYGLDQNNDKVQALDNDSIHVYPREYFYPLSYDYQNNIFTDNTCMIHHFDATWASGPEKAKLFFRRHNMKFMMKTVDVAVCLKRGIKSIVTDKMFWTFLLITIAFFGILYRVNCTGDTYTIFTRDIKVTSGVFFTAGRFITGTFLCVTKMLGLGLSASYHLSFVIAILCMTLALYKMYRISTKLIGNKWLSAVISMLIVVNIFTYELFVFWEFGIMVFALLMNVMAIDCIMKFFEGKKKYIIFAFICMLLANFSYQGTVGLFVSVAVLLILKYSKNIKGFIINNIIVGLVYIIPTIIDLVMVKLFFNNSRMVESSYSLFDKFEKIVLQFKQLLTNTFNILPKYMFAIILGVVILWAIYLCIRKNKGLGSKILEIFKIIYISAAVVILAIAPQIMLNYESIWMQPRTTICFASIIGILLLYITSRYDLKKITKYAIFIASILFMLFVYTRFQKVFVDHYIMNYMDENIVNEILSEISNYEKKSGVTVKNIALYRDKNQSYTYKDITLFADTNVSTFYPDWSVTSMISYIGNRNFEEVDADKKIDEEYFKDKNWTSFNKDQLVFVGDTLNLCRF